MGGCDERNEDPDKEGAFAVEAEVALDDVKMVRAMTELDGEKEEE